jgi:hypothetical protein
MEQLGYGPIPQVSYDPQLRYVAGESPSSEYVSFADILIVWFDLEKDQLERLPIPHEFKDMEFYILAFEDASLGNRLFWASRGAGNTGMGICRLDIKPTDRSSRKSL